MARIGVRTLRNPTSEEIAWKGLSALEPQMALNEEMCHMSNLVHNERVRL